MAPIISQMMSISDPIFICLPPKPTFHRGDTQYACFVIRGHRDPRSSPGPGSPACANTREVQGEAGESEQHQAGGLEYRAGTGVRRVDQERDDEEDGCDVTQHCQNPSVRWRRVIKARKSRRAAGRLASYPARPGLIRAPANIPASSMDALDA